MSANAHFDGAAWQRYNTALPSWNLYLTPDANDSFVIRRSASGSGAITFTNLLKLFATGGINLGAPTGGDKGAGTLNAAGDIYKNGTAFTNPDYVLEHWATGKIVKYAAKVGASDYQGLTPLSELKEFISTNFHLPRFGQKAGHGLFSGGDGLLASLEEAYLHIIELEERLSRLEDK
jgi:hypothetical protein